MNFYGTFTLYGISFQKTLNIQVWI